MRILRIRLQNLNSLRGEHVVDLESGPLAEAGLFAITGPTGSGKSTVLDAITLALYARAARYGPNDPAEEMMSRSAGECSASVEFACESGRCTAKWTLRRSRGKPDGKFQSVKHEISQHGIILEEKTRGVVAKIEALTGLDYDRFLRSVLLAQGQFAAFLKAKRDDRADLLERITGSQLYSELGALAHTIGAAGQREIKEATDRMSGIEFLPPEQCEAMAARRDFLTKELGERETAQQRLQARVNAAKRAMELEAAAAALVTEEAQLAEASQAFVPDDARLRRHAATLPFEPLLGELAAAELASTLAKEASAKSAATATAARQVAAQAAGSAHTALDDASAAETAAVRAVERRRNVAAEELGSLQSWMSANASDAGLAASLAGLSVLADRELAAGTRIRSAEAQLAAAQKETASAAQHVLTTADASKTATERSVSATRQSVSASATLAGLLAEPWTTQAQLEKETTRLSTLTDMLKRLQAAHLRLARDEEVLSAVQSQLAILEAQHQTRLSREEAARLSLDQARREEALLHELVRKEQTIRSLEEHRKHLRNGEPCPLCGAMAHPWEDPGALPPDDSAAQRLLAHQKTVTHLQSASRQAAAALSTSAAGLAAAKARLEADTTSLAAARRGIEQEWQTHFPDTPCGAMELEAAASRSAAQLDAAEALLTNVRAASLAERDAQTAALHAASEARNAATVAGAATISLNRAHEAENAARADLSAAKAHHTASLEALTRALADCGETSPGDPAAALERLRLRDENWRTRATSAASQEKQIASLDHDLAALRQRITFRENRYSEFVRAVAEAGVIPATGTTSGDWEKALEAFNRAATALHAADSVALASQRTAAEATVRATGALTALESRMAGSEFPDTPALRAARLEEAALKSLTTRRDSLHHLSIRLSERRTALEQDRAALMESLTALLAPEPPRFPGPEDLRSWQETLTDFTTASHSLRDELGALGERLSADTAARARYAAASAELEEKKAASVPWQRLASLIGSATGDRFSRYAQSVTLEHLVILANARLTQLCDRYSLLRSGPASDLQLCISDAWQADTVRPMESLSGGETFLVSLALALGLSELAGRRTRIGTLFIDEGFGMLDNTALDIALSALEGLRTGHSTIGIISHVEALKARLTTQIEVARGPGGWSTLTVRT